MTSKEQPKGLNLIIIIKKYNCTNPFLVGASLPGQALWITMTTCTPWQTQTLLPGSFLCLPPIIIKKYNCTNPFLVGASLPGQALWITMTTCTPWQTQTLLPGSFLCLPPGDPLSGLLFLLWVFTMLLDSVQAVGCKLQKLNFKVQPQRGFIRKLIWLLKGYSLVWGRTRTTRFSLSLYIYFYISTISLSLSLLLYLLIFMSQTIKKAERGRIDAFELWC